MKLGKYEAEIVECCPVCGGDGKYVCEAKSQRDNIPITVYECPDCESAYNNPRMTRESVFEYYKSGDYAGGHKSNNNGERARALRRVALITQFDIETPTRCLDVGCAEGHFLERMKDIYWNAETVGYDLFPSEKAIRDVIGDKSKITGKFNFISSIHSLEHMYDPFAGLTWMESLLSDGGTFFLEIPTLRLVSLAHPITFSLGSVKILMKHMNIENYTTINGVDNCIVLARK